jgi:DNA-binding MarR family transcriptional regulator
MALTEEIAWDLHDRVDDREAVEGAEAVEALFEASRALVGIAVRSLEAWDGDITLVQYRMLALLHTKGSLRPADVAAALAMSPPNATRTCDRLARKALVRRTRSRQDRRSVTVSLTPQGEDLVERVSAARRSELQRIVGRMSPLGRDQFINRLREFTAAAEDGGR